MCCCLNMSMVCSLSFVLPVEIWMLISPFLDAHRETNALGTHIQSAFSSGHPPTFRILSSGHPSFGTIVRTPTFHLATCKRRRQHWLTVAPPRYLCTLIPWFTFFAFVPVFPFRFSWFAAMTRVYFFDQVHYPRLRFIFIIIVYPGDCTPISTPSF